MGVAPIPPMHRVDTLAPVLDSAVLTELDVLGAEVVNEIVELFVADVPQRLTKLQQAIAARAGDTILREAHGLKGSALGAAIEHDARAGLLDQTVERSVGLESEFDQVRRALTETRG
jgi:HPt (histidine-containing phosphotransfer) domain-containing protein